MDKFAKVCIRLGVTLKLNSLTQRINDSHDGEKNKQIWTDCKAVLCFFPPTRRLIQYALLFPICISNPRLFREN